MHLCIYALLSKLQQKTLNSYSLRLIPILAFIGLGSVQSASAGSVVSYSDIWDDDSGGGWGNVIACSITDVSYLSWKYHDATERGQMAA